MRRQDRHAASCRPLGLTTWSTKKSNTNLVEPCVVVAVDVMAVVVAVEVVVVVVVLDTSRRDAILMPTEPHD